ncbi:MAG: formate dehydrogenase subunit alpha [Thermoplasmata archaeon]
MATVKTVCPYCGVGCNIIVETDFKRIYNFIPSKREDINYGTLCIKGWKGLRYVKHNSRLKRPLIKDEKGNFKETDWDTAVDTAISSLMEILKKYGPDSLAFQASAKCTNEENYLMQKLARQVFHTNNVDHCARSCHASTIEGLITSFGSGAMTTSIRDIDNAELYFVIGSNTTEQHPVIGSRIINNRMKGKTLIVADPRKIKLAEMADIYLRHYPGTDLALLNSMAYVIIEKKLYDREFIEKRTENFEEFSRIIENYDPDVASRITGVEPEYIERAAVLYATKKSITFYAMGITQHTQGTENVQAIANLALLTGNVGRSGTGVAPLRGHNNVQGSSDMGALCDFLPGYRRVYDENGRKIFEEAWNCELPSKPGLSLTEMFEYALEGKIKAMYIMGENPVLSEPESEKIIKSLENLEFLVVQDIFMTETAEYADVVFPSQSFAEKLGTFTNTERRIQLIKPFLDPPGEAKSDWEIIQMIANSAGYSWNYNDASQIMDEISGLVPQYSSVNYKCLEMTGGLQWPVRECHGTEILHTERFTRGSGRFNPSEWKKPIEFWDQEYPFILTTGRVYYQFHTGVMTRKVYLLEREAPEPYVEINPEDAKNMGIKNNENIRIETRHGELCVKARITDMVPRGILFMPFHYIESPANAVTNSNLDPRAKIPELKVTGARIGRCQ